MLLANAIIIVYAIMSSFRKAVILPSPKTLQRLISSQSPTSQCRSTQDHPPPRHLTSPPSNKSKPIIPPHPPPQPPLPSQPLHISPFLPLLADKPHPLLNNRLQSSSPSPNPTTTDPPPTQRQRLPNNHEQKQNRRDEETPKEYEHG
ncbi:hypothetical protein N7G274_002705 [Stereocaulon virgatum]|uniref:Uncharacterized protein n=1 Tax=Stereocaulon virgatum TaxID=373712 RepID=A0ABR4AGQ0_9LECA